MNDSTRFYEVNGGDVAKDKLLKYGAWLVPLLLSVIPAVIFFVLGILSAAPPAVAAFFFAAFVSFFIGAIFGLIISGTLLFYRSRWLKDLRERLAVDGVKAHEVDWFQNELTSAEKNALREIEKKDRLLGDAYRETLASRITATRISRSSRRELHLIRKRQNKLKYLKVENSGAFGKQLGEDREKIEEIKQQSDQMGIEAETRLQIIEAASRRGTSFIDAEIALQKLSARSEELPLALEALKMEDDLRKEIEKELEQEKNS
jgi:hypothetical protein